MIGAIIIILLILWFLGYIRVSGLPPIPDFVLFSINNHPITLWNLLILLVIIWAIGILPSPFQEIAGVFLILWILAVLGILVIAGLSLSGLLIIAFIVGLLLYLLAGI